MNILIKLLLFLILFAETVKAQDIQFSQFYNHTSWQNAALCAYNKQLQSGLIYRNPTSALTSSYVTFSGNIDVPIQFTDSNKYLGIGLVFSTESAGSVGYKDDIIRGIFSYHGSLLPWLKMHTGFGFSYAKNTTGNIRHMVFADQIDGNGNTTLPTNQSITAFNSTRIDFDAGLAFDVEINAKLQGMIGASIFRIMNPEDMFLGAASSTFDRRFVVHGRADYSFNEELQLQPHFLMLSQGKINMNMVGANLQFGNEQKGFLVGSSYKLNNAMVFQTGLLYKNLIGMISYDVQTGDAGGKNAFGNVTELYIGYKKRLLKKS